MSLTVDQLDVRLYPAQADRLAGAVRYAGVLALWAGLFVIRPRLAMQIFRERRADSPLRRRPKS